MSKETIASMLAQLKDLSEMMVDLAYSALLFGSEEVADHVIDMEKTMEILHTEFEFAILGLREERPINGLLGILRIGGAAKSLASAATTIADIVKRGVRAHPVIQLALERSDETIIVATVAPNSNVVGKAIKELGLEDDIGMHIVAVKSGDYWTYNPASSFKLNIGDLVIAHGYAEGREKFLNLIDPSRIHPA
ncbi:MAG: potassium channel family protein [Candidatus Bathyarchaeia archaeon]